MSQSPTDAATTANPAAGTVVTEMNTPTSAADLADTSDSMPAAPASSATTNDSGPTWKMKSTSVSSRVLRSVIQPSASPLNTKAAVTVIATGKPTSRAIDARRARYIRRRTSATASAASGPNSGPTTMAPTTVTGESVITPTAAIMQARHRNNRKVMLRVDSSRVRATSSSQTMASPGSPSACFSARWAAVDSTVSTTSRVIAPLRRRPSALRSSTMSLALSRAMSAVISSPGGSNEALRCSTIWVTPGWLRNAPITRSRSSTGAITRKCSTPRPYCGVGGTIPHRGRAEFAVDPEVVAAVAGQAVV